MSTPTYTNTADYHRMLQAQSNQMIQGVLANQQNIGQLNSMAAAQQWGVPSSALKPPVTVVASMSPLAEVAKRKIRRLIDQLPMKVISRIHLIELHDMGTGSFKFVVTYTDFRTQDFCNVDEFPSPADVSLVLLGTP